jgi:hypothetical protein
MMPRRLVTVLVLVVAATGCASAGPAPTATGSPDGAAATPTPLPPTSSTTLAMSTPTPVQSRIGGPIQAIVVDRSESADSITYKIAIAPATEPLVQATAEARAVAIGTATGLGKPDVVWKDEVGGLWRATWSGTIQDIPVDGSIADLELLPDGTVRSLVQTTGPLAPKPSKVLTEAEAIRASKSQRAPDQTTLVWSYVGSEDGATLRLEWRLTWNNVQPDGGQWPCSEWLDAGTGKELQAACVS